MTTLLDAAPGVATAARTVAATKVYGSGESERILGRLLTADPSGRDRLVIATKFWPAPWRARAWSRMTCWYICSRSLMSSIQRRVARWRGCRPPAGRP